MSIWNRIKGTFARRDVESRLDSELDLHLDLLAERFQKEDGLTAQEARLKARRQIGNLTSLREQGREADLFIHLENLARDFRQSLRGLRKRPAFAITTVSILAIGIGSVAALFSVADATVWKPVAWTKPDELVVVNELKNGRPIGSNGPRLLDWQTAQSFSSATGFYSESLVWKGPDGGGESVVVVRTYTGMMATAQPAIALGRRFTTDEEAAGAEVAVVTYDFWRSRLHSDANITSRALELSGKTYPIVGVLGASVGYPDLASVWIPATQGLQHGTRSAGYLGIVGRLKPGVNRQQAQAEIATIAARLREQYKATDATLQASLTPMTEQVASEARKPMLILLSIAVSVLLMICINIAALLLSRGVEREQECAMRSALGASVSSLVRLYLMETLMLAFAGGALGIIVASLALEFLKIQLPAATPRLSDAVLDWRALAVAMAASLASALIAGIIPAFLVARKASVRRDARGSVATSRQGLRAALAVVEIALSVFLVSTAVRLGESFLEITNRPLTFRTDEVVVVDVPFPWSVSEEKIYGFINQALPRFEALPGVTSAGFIDQIPLHGGTQDNDFLIEGRLDTTPIHGGFRSATTGYFATLSIPLLNGRLFEDRPGRRELVVNQTFARRFLGDEAAAIGKRVSPNRGKSFYEVVGVVADVPQDPTKDSANPEIFTYFENSFWAPLHFVLRTNAPVAVLAPEIRQQVAKLNPSVLVKSVTPMREQVASASKQSRVRSEIIGGFALLALVLMAIGLHGLIASDVSTRWREFGVRLALGAGNSTIRGLLLRKTGLLLLGGCVAGVVLLLTASRVLEASIEGMAPARATTALAVALAVLVAAASAILWPLRRLGRIDPSTALRHE